MSEMELLPAGVSTAATPARVLLVHRESSETLDLVESIAELSDGIEVRTEHSIERAGETASAFDPAVVLLDAHMLRDHVPDAVRALGSDGARVVVLAEVLTGDLVLAAITAGCEGLAFSREAAERFLGSDRRDGAAAGQQRAEQLLTRRQREVLALIVEGLSTPEIAQRLFISRNTARNHVRQVLERLGVHSKLQAMKIAIRDGLVELPD